MRLQLYIILSVTLAVYCNAYPCSGSSCRPGPSCNSQDCDSSSDCSESCDRSYSCRGNSCRNSYSCCNPASSCSSLQTCDSRCCESKSCCKNSCCSCPCPPTNTTPSRSTTSTPSTSPPWLPPSTPWRLTFSLPPPSSTASNITNINNNNNTVTIPTNITIQNEIHSETRITVPVNITVNNVNNIQMLPAISGHTTGGGEEQSVSNTTVLKVTTELINNTIQVPYPVQVPIPVPYVITMPQPQPVPTGCCQIVQPCMPYHYCGCQQSSIQCSNECSHQYSYQPIDVCNRGCFRRNMAVGQQCSFGGCFQGFVDCSSCNTEFYRSYDTFLRCARCFVPMPWGQAEMGPSVPSNYARMG